MKANINWLRDGTFVGVCMGHSVLMDVPEGDQTTSLAPSPMDMLLIGAGGCTSYDVVTLLKEAGQDITDCHVSMTADVQDTPPETFRTIHVQYHLKGKGLEPSAVQEVIRQSQETYSVALISLLGVAALTSGFEISEA
jgi:putative redox protein